MNFGYNWPSGVLGDALASKYESPGSKSKKNDFDLCTQKSSRTH